MDAIPICRVCLKTSLEYIDFDTPFELDDADNEKDQEDDDTQSKPFTYLDCFRKCTHLDLAEVYDDINDINVPQSLCDACGMELRITYNFLQKAENAHQMLQEAMLKTKLEINDDEGIEYEETQQYLLEGPKNGENAVNEDLGDLEEVQISEVNENTDEDKDYFYDDDTENVNLSDAEDFMLEILKCETDKIMEVDRVNTATKTQRIAKSNVSNMEAKYHKCSICRQNIRLSIFDAHMNICSEYSSAFQCTHCSSTFSTHHSLMQHSKVHDTKPKMPIVCKICSKEIPKGQLQREHTQLEHSHIVQCSTCEHKCKESRMLDHVRRSHEDHTDLFCNFCSKTFTTKTMFSAHLKYHQRKEASIKSDACEICGKQFSTQHYLRQHLKVHCNERELYQCENCDKVYVSKTALENHIRLHKGETIECAECGKHFSRQYELGVHMRFHTRNYPFECEICGKKFAIKGHLRTHQWRHQGLKLQCEECGKLFTSTKALQEHSFVHSEMPFPCGYCGRGYPSKQKFKVHLKTTHFIELNDEELQKIRKNHVPKPLVRKKLTLVQADTVMKEVEVKSKEDEGCSEDVEEILVELC